MNVINKIKRKSDDVQIIDIITESLSSEENSLISFNSKDPARFFQTHHHLKNVRKVMQVTNICYKENSNLPVSETTRYDGEFYTCNIRKSKGIVGEKKYCLKVFQQGWEPRLNGDYGNIAKHEFMINRNIRHENICKFYGMFTISEANIANGCYVLKLEYLQMSLFDVLTNAQLHENKMTPKQTTCMAKQLSSALDYLHSCGVAHNDINPHTIRIKRIDSKNIVKELENCIYKLSNFSLATKYDLENYQRTYEYEPMVQNNSIYVAPEKMSSSILPYNAFSSDIYSFGVVILATLVGESKLRVQSDIRDPEFLNKLNIDSDFYSLLSTIIKPLRKLWSPSEFLVRHFKRVKKE